MAFRTWASRKLLKYLTNIDYETEDASSANRDPSASTVKRVGLRQGDITSKQFDAGEFDLSQIQTGYNADSYIRQGVDKYVDQIFKEGFDFYGKNQASIDYIKQRLSYIAEATSTPTTQLFTDIAEDVVKYANCFIAKVRVGDTAALPQGVTITGIAGKQPIGGYFCVNATSIKLKRDKTGLVQGYQQEVGSAKVKFNPEDMIHIYYKREKGNAFGTPFLWPVLDDVRALRQAEENVLRMMYRNIHPFNHVAVGTDEIPGTETEITEVQDAINSMDVQGGIVTSNRVSIKAIASDQVINAEPYLAYLEQRVFSGMGVPAIMFGRGDTANRSTGDNMTSEMSDRIKAIQRTIECTINDFMIKELLMEGGFDPVLNPDDAVFFKFKENDIDTMIKLENQAVFLFTSNAITEDEMRMKLNMEPIADGDRAKLNRELTAQTTITTTQATAAATGKVGGTGGGSTGSQSQKPKTSSSGGASKAASNKVKPTNQYGTKTSPKKTTNSAEFSLVNLIDNILDENSE
jgi:hypothetical protein